MPNLPPVCAELVEAPFFLGRVEKRTALRQAQGKREWWLQRPEQPHGNRGPRRVADDLLTLAGAEREEVEFLAIDVEQPREEQAARGAGDEQVAVERAAPVALDPTAPAFIAFAIIAPRRGDPHSAPLPPRQPGTRLPHTPRRGSTHPATPESAGMLR